MTCSPFNEKVHRKKVVTLKDSQKKSVRSTRQKEILQQFLANNLKSHRESGILDLHFKEDRVDVLFLLFSSTF